MAAPFAGIVDVVTRNAAPTPAVKKPGWEGIADGVHAPEAYSKVSASPSGRRIVCRRPEEAVEPAGWNCQTVRRLSVSPYKAPARPQRSSTSTAQPFSM
ncbi:MAG: hypothetical protein J5743_00300 [Victivallales bacterium]|nr:hypothetical protein [Victivallales bacterium]